MLLMLLVNKLVKKIEEKRPKLHKLIITPEFERFSDSIFHEKIKQSDLATKTNITDFITKTYFKEKLRKN